MKSIVLKKYKSETLCFVTVTCKVILSFILVMEISTPVQTSLETYPASYTMDTVCFIGVKQPGRGFDYPPPTSALVKEREEL